MRGMLLLLSLFFIETPTADAQWWGRRSQQQQEETTGPQTSVCDDLSNGVEDRMDRDPDSLAGVRQARHQGETPGRFGSCATYTSVARFNAILKKEGLTVPPEFEVKFENLVRVFNAYGRYGRLKGNAAIITGKMLAEFLENHCPPSNQLKSLLDDVSEINNRDQDLCKEGRLSCDPNRIIKYLDSYNPNSSYNIIKFEDVSHYPRNNFSEKLVQQFKKEKPRIPIELHYNPDILHLDEKFIERGDGHASLVTGRRKTQDGGCQILVRNSYKGNCMNGKYKDGNRDCDNETDSVWVEEDVFYKGTDNIRIIP